MIDRWDQPGEAKNVVIFLKKWMSLNSEECSAGGKVFSKRSAKAWRWSVKTFGKIESQFWGTMRHEELSDQGKLLAAYLLTCKHGNMIGIFSLPRAYIMGDLKWDAETVEITVSEMLANRFLSVSAKTDFICINKFMAHNRAENVKQMEARLRLLLNLPESLSNDLPMFTNLVSGELLKASSFKGGSETRRLIEQVRSKFTKRSEPVSEQ